MVYYNNSGVERSEFKRLRRYDIFALASAPTSTHIKLTSRSYGGGLVVSLADITTPVIVTRKTYLS